MRKSLFFIVLFAFYGCGAWQPAAVRWPALPDGFFMMVGSFIQVSGTGLPPDMKTSHTQRRAEARDAAITDAWLRLREYISKLPLLDGSTVGALAAASPEVNRKIHDLVISSQIISTTYDGDRAAVILRIDKNRINKVLNTDFR